MAQIYCKKCSLVFKRITNKKNHNLLAHSKRVRKIICPLCAGLYGNLPNLLVHLKKHHDNQQIDENQLEKVSVNAKCKFSHI